MIDEKHLLAKLMVKKGLFQCYSHLTELMKSASLDQIIDLLDQRQVLITEVENLNGQINDVLTLSEISDGIKDLIALIDNQVREIIQMETEIYQRIELDETLIRSDIKKNNSMLKVKRYLINSEESIDSGTFIHPESMNA